MPLTLVITKAERDLVDTIWPTKTPDRPHNDGLLTTFSPKHGADIVAELAAFDLVDPDDDRVRKRLSDRVIDLCGPGVLFEKPVDNQPDMFDSETSVSKDVD